jgi:hypothetical protein
MNDTCFAVNCQYTHDKLTPFSVDFTGKTAILGCMDNDELREKITKRLRELYEEKPPSHGVTRYGVHIAQQRFSDWKNAVPTQWVSLRIAAEFWGVSADYILRMTDNRFPKSSDELTVNQRSVADILQSLPEYRQEEVIRLAEVVLETYRKEEKAASEPSLYEKVKTNYEKGNDVKPRIIGEEEEG